VRVQRLHHHRRRRRPRLRLRRRLEPTHTHTRVAEDPTQRSGARDTTAWVRLCVDGALVLSRIPPNRRWARRESVPRTCTATLLAAAHALARWWCADDATRSLGGGSERASSASASGAPSNVAPACVACTWLRDNTRRVSVNTRLVSINTRLVTVNTHQLRVRRRELLVIRRRVQQRVHQLPKAILQHQPPVTSGGEAAVSTPGNCPGRPGPKTHSYE
jgi:hypothetical protein